MCERGLDRVDLGELGQLGGRGETEDRGWSRGGSGGGQGVCNPV